MPQAKKKTNTKTAAKKQGCGTKKCNKTSCAKAKTNQTEKYHVYLITALSMITAILLCADIAFML